MKDKTDKPGAYPFYVIFIFLLSAKNYFCNGFKQLLSKGYSACTRNALLHLITLLLNKCFALTLAIHIKNYHVIARDQFAYIQRCLNRALLYILSK